MKKVPFPLDKKLWSPGLLPGPLALVSTCDAEGEPNLAPISWIQMASFKPPILMFSGAKSSNTAVNSACGSPRPPRSGRRSWTSARRISNASCARRATWIAEADPFVKEGAETCEVRAWELSCRENNHLGMG